MVYTPHTPVKPEQLVATAAVQLEQAITLPALMHREGIDQFKGAKDDTINVKVEGVLPFRTYGWRNDRAEAIQFDTYTEKTVAVKFGGDLYSALELTDEQRDFDLDQWTKLSGKQVEALARGLNYEAAAYIEGADYAITLGTAPGAIRQTLINARNMLKKMNAPGKATFVVGSDLEATILAEPDLVLAQNVGDARAESALGTATIGQLFGFDIVVAQEIDPGMGYFLTEGAFVFISGAPTVPQSAPFGATASTPDGTAVRWIRDYDATHMVERSVFNLYRGFRSIEDSLIFKGEDGQPKTSDYVHFMRGIKCVLTADNTAANAATVVPVKASGSTDAVKKANEFVAVTGIKKPELPVAAAA